MRVGGATTALLGRVTKVNERTALVNFNGRTLPVYLSELRRVEQ